MSKKHYYFFSIFGVSIFLLLSAFTTGNSAPTGDLNRAALKQNNTRTLTPDINFGNIPLYFIQNKGQVNKTALFYAKTPGYTLWVMKEGLVFDSIRSQKTGDKNEPSAFSLQHQQKAGENTIPDLNSKLVNRDISRLIFVGANKDLEISSLDPQELKVNYFNGHDKSKWIGGIPTSAAVLYKNIYNHIDLKVYGIGKQIEYDWIVRSGGDPSDIKFQYKNVKEIIINKKGDLDIKTQSGKLIHKKPFAYQGERKKGKGKSDITADFRRFSKTTYGFKTGTYDKTKTLIIDPVVLAYSTYLGGADIDAGYGIAVDNNGYVYVTGYTKSTNFPTRNQYQGDQGDTDVFVTKIDTNQSGTTSLLYSTYLGGNSLDYGYGIAADNNGVVYVTGYTYSTNFPTLNQYQGDQPGADAFLTKIDTKQSGTASLLYSTYLGGDDTDNGYGIGADNSGVVYVTGYTFSADFPTLNQYQGDQGSYDVFITKIDTNQSGSASLLYSTYLGGNSLDYGYGIAADNNGVVYVTGRTHSTDFPTLNQYQGDQGDYDVFITKIDTNQSGAASLLYSTYLGGNSLDYSYGIAADNNGVVYVTGYTYSTNFPILNQYQGDQGSYDVFITKIDTNQSGSASLLYSTYLGGDEWEHGYGITADNNGVVYVTGYTQSTNFPTLNQYQGDQGDYDAFITNIDTNQSGSASLLYSTYLGGDERDYGRGIAADNNGVVYVTGYTQSTNFPTFNQYQRDQGSDDVFVTKISLYPIVTKIYITEISVTGEGGSVDNIHYKSEEGEDVKIFIYPEEGFEIDKIIDNGIEMSISNPYIISNIGEDHKVEIIFKKILYPPQLVLTGIRKTERAWIISKDYIEMKLDVIEHESPMATSAFILYKSEKGIWSEVKRYSTAGTYKYTEKYFKADESVSFKFSAMSPNGAIIAETNILTL